jgi:hypothetical protein
VLGNHAAAKEFATAVGTLNFQKSVNNRRQKNSNAKPHQPMGLQRFTEHSADYHNGNPCPEQNGVDSDMVMNGCGMHHEITSLSASLELLFQLFFA